MEKKAIVKTLEALSLTGVNDREAAVVAAASGEVAAGESTARAVRCLIEPNLPDSPEAAAAVAALLVKTLTLPDGTKTSESKGKKEPKGSLPHARALVHNRIRAAFARAKAEMAEGNGAAGSKVRALARDAESLLMLADANIEMLTKAEKPKFADVSRVIAAWRALRGEAVAQRDAAAK